VPQLVKKSLRFVELLFAKASHWVISLGSWVLSMPPRPVYLRSSIISRSRGSSVSIVTMLRAGRPGFDFRRGQWRDFFLFATASRPALGKATGREVGHWSPLVPRLRMRGAIPPLPKYVFMAWYLVKHRDKFTFTVILSTHLRPSYLFPWGFTTTISCAFLIWPIRATGLAHYYYITQY
jgi:hypothetical protein